MVADQSLPPWPTPADGQTRLTLLGTPHLANPGADEHNVEVDDVLTPTRQSELRTVCERLEPTDVDTVAVEIPVEEQAALDDQYAAVRDGAALDDADAVPSGPAAVRSEVVQIGFRLARSLGHDRVYGVDSRPPVPDFEGEADFAIDLDADRVPYPVPDIAAAVEERERRLADSTILEVLRANNRPDSLQTLHVGNVAASLTSGGTEDFVGARQLAWWYERNARMLQSLIRVSDQGTATLFIVGTGHVVPVKELAAAAPMTCPRRPHELFAAEPD